MTWGNRRLPIDKETAPERQSVESLLEGIPAEDRVRPRTRADCSPPAETVDCPLPACTAPAGSSCVQVDPDTGKRLSGPPHPERINAARAHLRPCPWICKWHLGLDVDPKTGTITLNSHDLDITELESSCALDIADRGGATLDQVGTAMNLTRERMRQMEGSALRNLALVARKLLEPEELRLMVEHLAAKTRFDTEAPIKLVQIGNCPKCKTQRVKRKGGWRCRCRKEKADS